MCISGWNVRFCRASFPMSYFEALEAAEFPSVAPTFKFWSPDGASLLSKQHRDTAMNIIDSRAKEVLGLRKGSNRE